MKFLKTIAPLFLLIFALTFSSCGGCDNENPTVTITNLGTEEISVKVKTSNGNTENLNNVMPGETSEARSFDPGDIVFTMVIDSSTEIEQEVMVDFCEDYKVTLNVDNSVNVTSSPRD